MKPLYSSLYRRRRSGGQTLSEYEQDNAGEGTIIGVCKDFRLTSFNSAITPMQIILQEIPVDQATYLSCRIDEGRRNEIVKNLRLLWEKHEPDILLFT